MASITKLFTTTCILKLLDQEKLSLNDKVYNFFEPKILNGIHTYKGKDYSSELIISDLLFQTSGLPDVFLEGIASIFMGEGELLGHTGSTGSFAFYYPIKDLFIVGDINQMAYAALPIRLSMKLAMAIK